MSLESQAQSRKERLAKLRAQHQPSQLTTETTETSETLENTGPESYLLSTNAVSASVSASAPEDSVDSKSSDPLSILPNRNFDVESRMPRVGFLNPPSMQDGEGTLEAMSKAEEEAAIKRLVEREDERTELQISDLKARRDNWDLKRSLERDFKILDRRTDKAILQELRRKLKVQERAEIS